MKIAGAVAGLTGLLIAGSASAGVQPGNALYSSFVTNNPDFAVPTNYPLTTGALTVTGSPLAQEFHVGGTTQLTSLWLRLSDPSPTDGGSILVYLVPNNPVTSLPTSTGLKLTNTTLLGSIFDSTLPPPTSDGCQFGGVTPTINSCNTFLAINDTVAAGDYWIALVNGSDANNGGNALNPSSGASWWRSAGSVDGTNPGINTTGNFAANVAINGVLTNAQHAAFELQVNAAPEPTTLALLGTGLAALGFASRRRSRKSAE